MNYYGDFAEDSTVYIPFNTFDSNDPAASVTVTNLADADIKVHKDGGVAQIVTDGATIAIDFDGITGNHLITIDTSVHADYAVGSDYMVRLEGITVDAGSLNVWVGSFSIENRVVASVPGAVGSVTGAVGSVTGAVGSVTGAVGSVTAGVSLAAGAITDASLAGNMEIVFETDFATNYNTTRNAWATNAQDFVGTTASDPFNGQVVAASVTGAVGSVTGAVGSVAGNVDGNVSGTVTLANGAHGGAGASLTLSDYSDFTGAGSGLTALATGTAQSGTASTIVLAASAAFADNVLDGNVINIHTGTGAGQSRVITSNTLADDTVNVSPNWTTNPGADSQYEIVQGSTNIATIKTQVVTCAAGVTVNPSVGAATIQPTVTEFEARTKVSAGYFDYTTDSVMLTAGAITDATLAGNLEIVFETDFATNYNTTRNAWATNTQDFVGTSAADPFNGQVVAASVTGDTKQTADHTAGIAALPTLAEILAGGDVDGYTIEETLKICMAALAGKLSGAATTTITIRASDDSKDRITATVDADGNRSAVTLVATG